MKENQHCVLAMAQGRRTSMAAYMHWVRFFFCENLVYVHLPLDSYLDAGHPQTLYQRHDQVTSNCPSHQTTPKHNFC